MQIRKRLRAPALWLCTVLQAASCDRLRHSEPRLDPAGQMLLDPIRNDGLAPAALLARLHLPKDARVADVGAGPGYLTLPLAAALPNGRILATDVRREYLEVLAAQARRAGLKNIETRVVTPEDSGLRPRSMDLILLCQVDHYLKDRAAYLAHLRTALRPHGHIALVNYARYQEADHAAAEAAGLRIIDEWSPSVAFFLLVLDDPAGVTATTSTIQDPT